jgi:hypothetical protein
MTIESGGVLDGGFVGGWLIISRLKIRMGLSDVGMIGLMIVLVDDSS